MSTLAERIEHLIDDYRDYVRVPDAENRRNAILADVRELQEAFIEIQESGVECTSGDGHARCIAIARATLIKTGIGNEK